MNDVIEEALLSKEQFQELYDTFKLLTDKDSYKQNQAYYESKGIYPLYIGTGKNERLRGFRLGKSKEPVESGSVVIGGFIHTYEATSLAGLQEVLDLWKGEGAHKGEIPLYTKASQMSGDIYLLMPGDIEQGHEFFQKALSKEGITRPELSNYRLTHPEKGLPINRNRVISEEPPKEASQSQKELYEDFCYLKDTVYSRCATTDPNEKPGFIYVLHTSTQKNKPSGLPLFFPFPDDSEGRRDVFKKIKEHTHDFYKTIGAGYVLAYSHDKRPENYFEGVSLLEGNGIASHGANSIIRGTFECGQDCDPATLPIARNAVYNSIAFKWPELVKVRANVMREPTFYSNTQTWFAPGSPRANENPRGMAPPIAEGETYGSMHLITGHELTVEEKREWGAGALHLRRKKPERFVHLSDDILKAFAAAEPQQLGNEQQLHKGQAIAYMDVIENKTKQVRQILVRAPYACTCFMAPRNPDIPPDLARAEYIILTARDKIEKGVLISGEAGYRNKAGRAISA